jgi:ribonucleoside-diphosphate reductase alpha subunit
MSEKYEDCVINPNGNREPVSFDKILKRIKTLGRAKDSDSDNLHVNYTSLCQKIIDQLYDDITTQEIDELTAQQCASLATTHPDYGILASRILISNHHKMVDENYLNVVEKLYNNTDIHNIKTPIVSDELYNLVKDNHELIQSWFNFENDYLLDYFGFKTLERAYLLRINKEIVERPQHMWMRVSLGIHGDDFEKAKETYEMMSSKYFTHATPTLFNAGTRRPQLSSCYLIAMESDSINGIYNTLGDCAAISKWAGGIGMHIHNIRGAGSHIRGTNGTSNGIVPMLRVFNNTARYVDQGGGRRNGSFAIYLEPHHPDIMEFLDMKKNHGDEEARARDLFYALWLNDLFMERVKQNKQWTLMCPDTCRGLSDVYGEEFKELYEEYESKNMGVKTVNARDVWFKILDSQSETGVPYLLYKDACNKKSNQKNLGTIKSSNLCCEIVEYSDDKETAVCNLASIALSKFVKQTPVPFKNLDEIKIYTKKNCNWCLMMKNELKKNNISYKEELITVEDFESFKKQHNVETVPQLYDGDTLVGGYNKVAELLKPVFDYDELHKITKIVTTNLNKVIDINFYPTTKTRTSNMRNRPVGIGVQGLADTYALMNVPFHSDEAANINKQIFETMYHAALSQSNELAKVEGPYDSFKGSPASKGILQFDMWNASVTNDRYDWTGLKLDIVESGLRNSLLLAPMPTASTSQILGNNECFEPFTSNIYVRRTIAGEFIIINKHLLKELINIGLWNEDIKQQMVKFNGSIQEIKQIPQVLKDKYKIVWEIPMKHIINMAADRGQFICQSQSMNLWMKNPTYDKLTTMHFYSWSKGLKTGLYYLRTKAKAAPQQFTVEPDKMTQKGDNSENDYEEEDCLMCGS